MSGSGGTGCRMGACIWVSVGAHCRGARGAYGCLRVHTGAFVDVSGSPWPPAGPPGLSRGPPSRGAAGQACVASSSTWRQLQKLSFLTVALRALRDSGPGPLRWHEPPGQNHPLTWKVGCHPVPPGIPQPEQESKHRSAAHRGGNQGPAKPPDDTPPRRTTPWVPDYRPGKQRNHTSTPAPAAEFPASLSLSSAGCGKIHRTKTPKNADSKPKPNAPPPRPPGIAGGRAIGPPGLRPARHPRKGFLTTASATVTSFG